MQKAAAPPRIIFVCQGNICRSPFAAALLRARMGDCGQAIGSAGMMPQPGRATPSCGLAAAAAYGIDLSAHRSAWLSPEMAEAAAPLIVFDQPTRAAVLDRYPHLRVPPIRLGDLADVGEIGDPIDGGPAAFARAYDQIAAAIAALLPLLRAPAAPLCRR